MNNRLSRILIFSFSLVFNGFIWSQSGYSQDRDEGSKTIIDYVGRRLSAVQKQVHSEGKTYEAKLTLEALCPIYSRNTAVQFVAERVFSEYGAVFVGDNSVFVNFELLPYNNNFSLVPQCIFLDEAGVQRYQSYVKARREIIGGLTIELEENAMTALIAARKEAASKNLRITPRGGAIAARRSYSDTKRLWDSRFYPALNHWVGKKIIPLQLAEQAKRMKMIDQIAKVLEWEEKQNAFFSKDFTKSILYSVAPPGTSQHLFMLAIDIEQYPRRDVRDILASHGWYQTVKSDLPHFTYLGIKDKSELLKRGLKKEEIKGYEFWTPKVD